MSKPTDPPFEHEVFVGWGDCDPARIAYTARIPEWALQAIDAWWDHHLGGGRGGWFHMEIDRGFGAPFVSLSMDFRAPVTTRHRLRLIPRPVRLGRTSITFRVEGRQDGTLCFEGEFTSVFIDAAGFTPQPPPEDVRALVEAHLPAAG